MYVEFRCCCSRLSFGGLGKLKKWQTEPKRAPHSLANKYHSKATLFRFEQDVYSRLANDALAFVAINVSAL